jgi:N6-adenosine-specific RNA methylase IME4
VGDPMDDLSPPYGTIVVDPPWRYTNDRGTQTRARAGRSSTVAEGNYSTMSNAEIAALPVGDLAAPECALYLWVTNPRMFGHVNRHRDPIAPIDMVEMWGFTYITLLTWVKSGPPGMGFHFRGNTEHVIYATRGKLSIPSDRRVTNVIHAPRRGHSEKPDAFLDVVEAVSPGPYVELFSRRPRFGWDSWGLGYESGAVNSGVDGD